jgi:hypothetical protein
MLTGRIEAKGKINWVGRVAYMEDNRKAYRVLVVKPKVKKSLGGTRRTWKDNIKPDLKK